MSGDDPTPTSAPTAEDVIAEVADRNIRFIRLWFTDVLGQLKSFSINASELEDAFAGGNGFDGSSITGFNPIEESDMLAVPDPATFTTLPWSPSEQPTARMFCDIQVPGGDPYEGDPRWILRRAIQRAHDMGFDDFNVGPELEFFYFRDAEPGRRDPRGARRGRLLRPDDARRRLRRSPRDRPRAGADGHPRRVHPSRGRALPARGRHALQGRARDGRRLHDLPDDGQGVRDEERLARDVHAEAAERRERQRHARPSVAGPRRRQRLLRRRRPVLPVADRQAVHRRAAPAMPARSPRCSRSGSTPTSGSSPATRPRSTSPGHGAIARR